MTAATALPATRARPRFAVLVLMRRRDPDLLFRHFRKAVRARTRCATGFYRMFLALPIFALWMAQEGRMRAARRLPAHLAEWWELALCGFFLAADLAVWQWAIHMTSAANATLLGNMAPIYVALAGWLFFGERFRPLFLLGLALAIVGAALLLGVSLRLGGRSFLADLLAAGVGSLYAGYIIMLSRLRRHFSTAIVMTLSGGFFLLPLALLSGESLLAHSVQGWLILLGLAWLSQVAGQGTIAWSLAHLPPPSAQSAC